VKLTGINNPRAQGNVRSAPLDLGVTYSPDELHHEDAMFVLKRKILLFIGLIVPSVISPSLYQSYEPQ